MIRSKTFQSGGRYLFVVVILVTLTFISIFSIVHWGPHARTSIKQLLFTGFTSSSHQTAINEALSPSQLSVAPDWVPDTPFSSLLHKVQTPANCSMRKFLVYRMPKLQGKDTRNLGAMLTTLWRWVLLAMEDDRTVVIDSTNWNMADCPTNLNSLGGLQCYFLPFSSCDMSHVLQILPADQHMVLSLKPDEVRSAFKQHRVVAAPIYSPAFAESTFALDQGRLHVSGDDCQVMLSIITYFLRFNARTWSTISSNLQASIPDDFDPSRSIGIPIRASDKCMGHTLNDGSARGEMKCYDFQYYVSLAEELRASILRDEGIELDTIILTSEDPNIIQESKSFALTPRGGTWRFVYNSRDVLQGTGSSTSVINSETLKNQNRTASIWDVATSMFTSLLLQLQGKYLISHAKSSFLLLMGFLHQYCDSCVQSPKTTVWIRPLLMCNVLNITNRAQRAIDVNHTASVFLSLPRDAIVADH